MPPEYIRLPATHHVDHVSSRFQPRHTGPVVGVRGPVPLHPSLAPPPDSVAASAALACPEQSGVSESRFRGATQKDSFRRRKFAAASVEPPEMQGKQLEEMLRIERAMAQSKTDKMLLEQVVIENTLKSRATDLDMQIHGARTKNRQFGPVVFDGQQNTISIAEFRNTGLQSRDRSFLAGADGSDFPSVLTCESEEPHGPSARTDNNDTSIAKNPEDGTMHTGEDVSSPHPTIFDTAAPDDAFNTSGTLNISSVTKETHYDFGTPGPSYEPCVTFANPSTYEGKPSTLFDESTCSANIDMTPGITPFRSDPNAYNGYYSNLLTTMKQLSRPRTLNSQKKNPLLDAADSGESVANVLASIGVPAPNNCVNHSMLPKRSGNRKPPMARRSNSTDTTTRRSISVPAPRSISNSVGQAKDSVNRKQYTVKSFIDSNSDSVFTHSTEHQARDPPTEQSQFTLDFGETSAYHKMSIKLVETTKEETLKNVLSAFARPQSVIKNQVPLGKSMGCKTSAVLPTLIDRIPDTVILNALQNSLAVPSDGIMGTALTASLRSEIPSASYTNKEQSSFVATARLALKSAPVADNNVAESFIVRELERRQQPASTDALALSYTEHPVQPAADLSILPNVAAPMFVARYKDHLQKVDLAQVTATHKDWNFGNEAGGGHRAVHARYNRRKSTFIVKKMQESLTNVRSTSSRNNTSDTNNLSRFTSAMHSSGVMGLSTFTDDNESRNDKESSHERAHVVFDDAFPHKAKDLREHFTEKAQSAPNRPKAGALSSFRGDFVENFINARRSARMGEKKMITQPLKFDGSAGEFLYSDLSRQIGDFSNELAAFCRRAV